MHRLTVAAALAALLSACAHQIAASNVVAQAVTPRGVTITLMDSACALTDQITNLPRRATWNEGGKVDEGCYDLRPPMVWMYFNDKTVVVAPMRVFGPPRAGSI